MNRAGLSQYLGVLWDGPRAGVSCAKGRRRSRGRGRKRVREGMRRCASRRVQCAGLERGSGWIGWGSISLSRKRTLTTNCCFCGHNIYALRPTMCTRRVVIVATGFGCSLGPWSFLVRSLCRSLAPPVPLIASSQAPDLMVSSFEVSLSLPRSLALSVSLVLSDSEDQFPTLGLPWCLILLLAACPRCRGGSWRRVEKVFVCRGRFRIGAFFLRSPKKGM